MTKIQSAQKSTPGADWLVRTPATQRSGQSARVLAELRRRWDPPSQLHDRGLAAVAFEQLGTMFASLDDPDQAIQYLKAARIEYADCENSVGQARCLWSLGHLLARIGQLPGAIEAFEQAGVLVRALGDRSSESLVLTSLGNCLLEQLDQRGAIICFREALKLALDSEKQPHAGVLLLSQAAARLML